MNYLNKKPFLTDETVHELEFYDEVLLLQT